MSIRTILLSAAGAVMAFSMSGAALAQDPTPAELAQAQAKVRTATGVIAIGRADKDPMMLVVGAKLLSDLGPGAGADGKQAGDASQTFDVSQILDEAKALAGDNTYLLDEISALSSRPERASGKRCGWYEQCGLNISDPFQCEWVMVC